MKYNPMISPPTTAYLQFCATRLHGDEWQIDYELILPLGEFDIRGTRNHKGKKLRPKSYNLVWLDKQNNRHLPLGRTIVGPCHGNYPFCYSDRIDLPFRDGAHAHWDNLALGGLPLVYLLDDKYYGLEKEGEHDRAP